MAFNRIPDVGEQTELRKASLFLLGEFTKPGDAEPGLGVWLVRSVVDPTYRGIEHDLAEGDSPVLTLPQKAHKIAGLVPQYVDTVGTLEPGEHPDITRTTFIMAGFGRLRLSNDPNERQLPRPGIGYEMGFFPLDGLPLDQMRPAEAALIPGMLAQAAEAGERISRIELRVNEPEPQRPVFWG